MTNDDDLLTSAGLLPCFAPSVGGLADAIRAAAQPGGSEGAAPRNAEAHLLTIRANAAKDTSGLYDALDAVRLVVRAVEDIARREPTPVPITQSFSRPHKPML
ncbi:Gp37 family protein [Methylobacterium sp. J-059]|uniref:Gp37 family protein n=1 Tax=Methylobacterium sp. J-059 TaxID=2836643 RepID=UPI001FB9C6DD|nr:Gp37 family protein [Methylobacterium sp. J-059]MCJ2039240.1 Gp37 family protein [Methylobacterium sp. J-059]